MKQIRRFNTFETNSSSIHTLTIFNKNPGNIEKLHSLDSLSLEIKVGEFGWQFDVYSDPVDILRYLYTFACTKGSTNIFLDKLHTLLPNTKFIKPNYDVYPDCEYLDCCCGYIDHADDWGDSLDFAFESEENLANCLFDAQIRTGNDNSDFAETFFTDSGILELCKGN